MFERITDCAHNLMSSIIILPVVIALTTFGCGDGVGRNRATLRHQIVAHEDMVCSAMTFYIKPAQEVYFEIDSDADGVKEYAKTLGGKFGLVTARDKTKGTTKLWDDIAKAESGQPNAIAWNGYYFKLLLQQGEFATDGEKTYLDGENLVNGWAILAFPRKYGETGKHTYLMDSAGSMFRADLGYETATMASAIDKFNPDENIWSVWVP